MADMARTLTVEAARASVMLDATDFVDIYSRCVNAPAAEVMMNDRLDARNQ